MEKKFKINKNGTIGDALAWIVGIFVIVFILIVYLAMIALLGGEKALTEKNEINVQSSAQGNNALRQSFYSFLNSPVKLDNEEILMRDLILGSLDPYIEGERGENILKTIGGDVNKLGNLRPVISEEFFVETNAREEDDLVFSESQRILGYICEDYVLQVPQGWIISKKDEFTPPYVFENLEMQMVYFKGWEPWMDIEFPYKSKIIKIRYRRPKEC